MFLQDANRVIFFLQELIAEKGLGRRKRIIMITGGALVLIVIALIVACVIIFTDSAQAAPYEKEAKTITLEDVLDGRFNSKSFSGNGTWVSGMNTFLLFFFIQKPFV